MLKLLKNCLATGRLPGGTEKRGSVVAITANSQGTCRTLRQSLFMGPGSHAMDSPLTLLHCWALAVRGGRGQLTLTQHSVNTEKGKRVRRELSTQASWQRELSHAVCTSNASLSVFVCYLSMRGLNKWFVGLNSFSTFINQELQDIGDIGN